MKGIPGYNWEKTITVTSCNPGIYGRAFGGTFSGVLSGFCCSLDFKQAWSKAILACKGIEGIACPRDTSSVGLYSSLAGIDYFLGCIEREGQPKLYFIEFPEDIGNEVGKKVFKAELAFVGHSHCVTYSEKETFCCRQNEAHALL